MDNIHQGHFFIIFQIGHLQFADKVGLFGRPMQCFLVNAKTKCIDNDIPFDTKCDNSTKAIEVKKVTSSILVIVVSVLGGQVILTGILVNVLVFFCRQCHKERSFSVDSSFFRQNSIALEMIVKLHLYSISVF